MRRRGLPRAAAILGGLADTYGVEAVYRACSFLPLVGLLAWFLPKIDEVDAALDFVNAAEVRLGEADAARVAAEADLAAAIASRRATTRCRCPPTATAMAAVREGNFRRALPYLREARAQSFSALQDGGTTVYCLLIRHTGDIKRAMAALSRPPRSELMLDVVF